MDWIQALYFWKMPISHDYLWLWVGCIFVLIFLSLWLVDVYYARRKQREREKRQQPLLVNPDNPPYWMEWKWQEDEEWACSNCQGLLSLGNNILVFPQRLTRRLFCEWCAMEESDG